MPRSVSAFGGAQDDRVEWRNWAGRVHYVIPRLYRPASIDDIVWVLQQAAAEGRRVKAVGRGWAFEDAARSRDWVVSLEDLSAVLTPVFEPGTGGVLVTDERRDAMRRDRRERLVHVEAGIRIFDLNRALEARGLAMPTLGGSQGQHLGGVLATATHGGDHEVAPFADLVQALHLVSVGGQEWWIESSSRPLTDDDDLLRERLGVADIRIVRDDDLLHATVVGVGRFGIVYSAVLAVVPAYRLTEWTVARPWSEVRAELASGAGGGTRVFGGLTALDAPAWDLQIDTSPTDFRYLEVILSSRHDATAWVRRRWPTRSDDDVNLATSESFFCHNVNAAGMLTLVAAALRTYAGAVAAIPGYGWVKAAEIVARADELQAIAADPHLTGGHALSSALNAVWASQMGQELDWLIDEITGGAIAGDLGRSSGDGIRGPSWQVMAGVDDTVDEQCYRSNSLELVFPTDTGGYLDFVDAIVARGSAYAQSGYVAMRFCRRSRALLAMQNVSSPIAVNIEVASLAGLAGNEDWLAFVEDTGVGMGGRPHWGQQNRLTASAVSSLYGADLMLWRDQLARVVGPSDSTFSNDYTLRRGLEPSTANRRVTSVRRHGGRITHLCGDGYWSPVSVEAAIVEVRGERVTYVVADSADPPADRVLQVREHLTTPADTSEANNLDALPDVGPEWRAYLSPAIDLRRRVVTSVLRSGGRWPSIQRLNNDEGRWTVHVDEAFLHLLEGAYEYVLGVDGEVTPIEIRRYLTTQADERETNNLAALPDCPDP